MCSSDLFDGYRLSKTLCLGILGLAIFLGMGATSVPASSTTPPPEPGTGWQPKPEVRAQQYMAVTAHPLATRAAVDILSRGGNAVDAAISAQLVLNLVEPQSSGIGGGAFLLYWDAATKELHTLDGRETAPAQADGNYFRLASGELLKWREARIGGRAVGVPGTLHLLSTAHTRFGQTPWASLFDPAISIAREGFQVTPRLSESIKSAAAALSQSPTAQKYFFTEESEALPEGYLLKNPEFAQALTRIAAEGPRAFYEGSIGQRLLADLENTSELPSLMTAEDLASYQTIARPAVCAPYRQYSVCGMGPPSSGALTVGQILGLLERFDLNSMGATATSVHLVSEASRLAFADRGRYMADSDFVSVPVQGLLDPAYLNQRSQLIEKALSMGRASAGQPPGADLSLVAVDQPENSGTSHVSIVDRSGNIVSMTTTIESGFGSTIMTQGFLLNNEMTDFSFKDQDEGRPVANRVESRKRPRSSMAPTIVFNSDGQPILVAGSPGGSRIICYVTQALIGVLDWGLSPQDAVSMPHFCNRNGPTDFEPGSAADVVDALSALGHETRIQEMNSGLHLIQILPDGTLRGGADPRREGVAAGE